MFFGKYSDTFHEMLNEWSIFFPSNDLIGHQRPAVKVERLLRKYSEVEMLGSYMRSVGYYSIVYLLPNLAAHEILVLKHLSFVKGFVVESLGIF